MIRPTAGVRIALLLIVSVSWGGGCSPSTTMPSTGVIELDLKHQDPRFRIQGASRAVTENRVDLVPALVENLSDPDPAVRMFTATALRKLTNRDFDFRPYGSEAEREEAIERWKAWLRSDAGPGDSEAPDR